MIATLINPPENWSFWTAEKISELENATDNFKVGEQLVLENNEFKIWTIHLPAGESIPFHTHSKRYFWTALSAGKSISYYNDGSVLETQYEVNDVKYFSDLSDANFFTHNLENTGSTELIFMTVEFLKELDVENI